MPSKSTIKTPKKPNCVDIRIFEIGEKKPKENRSRGKGKQNMVLTG